MKIELWVLGFLSRILYLQAISLYDNQIQKQHIANIFFIEHIFIKFQYKSKQQHFLKLRLLV